MCLIAWNWQPESAEPLVLLSNRDEFYARPTQALHWWVDTAGDSAVLAGKDLQAGGTWLGVSASGRLAALTNYRSAELQRTDTPSRGQLVTNFLQGTLSCEGYLKQLSEQAQNYNPFNLLVCDGERLMGLESRELQIITFTPGIGGVSNANFCTPWPKLTRISHQLGTQLEKNTSDRQALLSLLHDTTLAADAELPDTGIELPLERALSAIFIATESYGTRSCSVVELHRDHADFLEQNFDAQGALGTVKYSFEICC
jgi:uncharacterized protein with NRDE domain